MSTTIADISQTGGGEQHLNTNPPPPLRVNQDEAELNQIKVQDWDEAEEDEAEAEENELISVQQEIERLREEQESIMRRQAATQRVERVRLMELQYTIDISVNKNNDRTHC
jgi:hypothetical protein